MLLLASCAGETEHGADPAPHAAAAGSAIFTERAAEAGLDFRHEHGAMGEYHFPEIMGAGGALFDMDGDGDLDAYLVQGAPMVPHGGPVASDRLYRNDSTRSDDGRLELRFVDVTARAGIAESACGMGAAAGDYDDDGDVDLYVTNFGPDALWRNDGDGGFTDVTAAAGVADERWSTSAAFFDYDRDGWLDLFVVHYVDFRATRNIECAGRTGRRDYCSPTTYAGLPARLLHNRGDGSFEDVSAAAGVLAAPSSGLGVVSGDFDDDGWLDAYVANDQRPNHLWMNQRDGTFADRGLLSGTAVDAAGTSQASMGVDAGDVDNDGDEDLLTTNLDTETNTLYVNRGRGIFEDLTSAAGLSAPTLRWTGFGTGFVDYDNDGWLDNFVANGAVYAIEDQQRAGDPFPYHEHDQLFHNLGDGRFEEVTAAAGPAFATLQAARGACFGDVDDDGDTDVLVTSAGSAARLLINEVGQSSGWIGLRLVGGRARRDMLGARVEVQLAGGAVRRARVRTDGSYLCANDPRVRFGLGPHGKVERVRVHWPDGASEEWTDLPTARYTTLARDSGRRVQGP